MHTLFVTKMVNSPSYIDGLVILDDRCSCIAFSNVMCIMAKICYHLLVDNTGSFLSPGVRRRRLLKWFRPSGCSSVDAICELHSSDIFETLHVFFCSWSEDVYVVWPYFFSIVVIFTSSYQRYIDFQLGN